MTKIPREPGYGKPPKWGKVYQEHCPDFTDPASRHIKIFSEALRNSDELRAALDALGYEPDHVAQSMEVTVIGLWRLRKRTSGIGE